MLQYTVYSMCRIFILDLLIISQAVFTLGLIGWSEPEVISYNISILHYLAPNCGTFASPTAQKEKELKWKAIFTSFGVVIF